jgi:RNase adapter protein RapZ
MIPPQEPTLAAQAAHTTDLVLVTGMSGGGKSIAMHALEDAGFFCVDNLPPELLPHFLELEQESGSRRRVAIAVDVRSAGSLPQLLLHIKELRLSGGVALRSIFLDADNDTLLRRFSETRRPHPLRAGVDDSDTHRALQDAIALERELLTPLRMESTVLAGPVEGLGAGPVAGQRVVADAGVPVLRLQAWGAQRCGLRV